MPRSAIMQSISSSPSSRQADATPGVAPVAASQVAWPGGAGHAGAWPAWPQSIALKALAQSVAPLTASTSSVPSETSPHAFAQSPQPTHTAQRFPDHRFEGAGASSAKQAPQPTHTAQRVPCLSAMCAQSCAGRSAAGPPGAVLPPGLMKNDSTSAITDSGMTVAHAEPIQPSPASRHAPYTGANI